ncbi:Translocation protein S66, partial [Cryomyces antarcticus]
SEKPTRVPDSVLKAALLRRATEDIHRLIAIRNAKGALKTLLARGSVGDDLGQRFDRAEKEIEDELKDVVNEANAFAPNWGQIVFQSASEMANNNLIRARMAELQSQAAAERAWWDKKRANTSSEFMKELDAAVEEQSSVSSKVAALDGDSSSRKGSVAASVSAGPRRGSDDDAVIVEGGGPAVGGQGSTRKKKAKK